MNIKPSHSHHSETSADSAGMVFLTAVLFIAAVALLVGVLSGCATTGSSPSHATPTETTQTVTANLAGIAACSSYASKHHDAAQILMRLDEADAALARGIGYDDLKALLFKSVNSPQDALYFAAGLALVEPYVQDRKATLVLGSSNVALIKALMSGCRSAALAAGTQTVGGSGADPWGSTWTACKVANDCRKPLPALWPGSRF